MPAERSNGPDAGPAAADEAPEAARPRRKTALWKKLLLSLGSLCVLLSLIELAARIYMPELSPPKLYEGYYLNPLPLITGTGGRPLALEDIPDGEPLAAEKAEGEIRIFVVGESSVEGSPLGTRASMPAMLYDRLRAALPDRHFTVVNMGRSSSVSANIFYYLHFIGRFEPDFIVFYMGMNDADGMTGEQCAPLRSPTLHAIWRGLVDSSWALWLTRVWGPQYLWRMTDRKDWYPPDDCPGRTFHLWTDILVEAALSTGARAVIATPVIQAATELEPMRYSEQEQDIDLKLSPAYRRLLACELEAGCDFSGLLEDMLDHGWFLQRVCPSLREPATEAAKPGYHSRSCELYRALGAEELLRGTRGYESAWGALLDLHRQLLLRVLLRLRRSNHLMAKHEEVVDYRVRAWQGSAERMGAELVPFHRALREASPHGILAERYFGDRQHLLPPGYYLLADLVSARIETMLTGAPERRVGVPTEADVRPYVEKTRLSGLDVALEQLVRGWYITGLPAFQYITRVFTPEICERRGFCAEVDVARVALGWLRRKAGLEPELPPELMDDLDRFRPLEQLEAARSGALRQRPRD